MHSSSGVVRSADLAEFPVFNPEKFDLLTLGDAALQRQLAESFLKQCPKSRAELVEAAQAGVQQFGDAIHRLKGSCHFTAADRMLQLLEIIGEDVDIKCPQQRILAAQAILEGLSQLEEALATALAQPRA